MYLSFPFWVTHQKFKISTFIYLNHIIGIRNMLIVNIGITVITIFISTSRPALLKNLWKSSRMQGAPVSNGRKESLWQDIYTRVRGLCDHNCSFQLRLCLHLQVCAIEYNCVFQVEHLDRCATILVKRLFKNLQQLNHDPQEEDGAIGKDEVMESGIHSANLCTI